MTDKKLTNQNVTLTQDDATLTPSKNYLLIPACFIIVVAGMKAAESILVPFLLSIFIAIIVSPLLFWFQRKKVPLWLSLILISLFIVAMGLAFVSFIGATLTDLSRSLPAIQQKLQTQLYQLVEWLQTKDIEVDLATIEQYVNVGSVMQLVSNLISQTTSLLTDGFLIFLTVIFILLEASVFPNKLKVAMKLSDKTMQEFSKFSGNVKRYLAIKTITSFITALLVAAFLYPIGVSYPILWALLAFVLNYVPNIGSIIAAIPPIILALVQLDFLAAIYTTIGYLAVNMVIGNIVEPRWMGKGLGLSTLVVFLSLVFCGWLFGPIGMLLSVPLTMVLKVVLENKQETRWLAIILGSEPPAQPINED